MHHLITALHRHGSLVAPICLSLGGLWALISTQHAVEAITRSSTPTMRLPLQYVVHPPLEPTVHHSPRPSVRVAHPPPVDDAKVVLPPRSPAPTLPATPVVRVGDEPRLTRERAVPASTAAPSPHVAAVVATAIPLLQEDHTAAPTPLSPAEALVELRRLEQTRSIGPAESTSIAGVPDRGGMSTSSPSMGRPQSPEPPAALPPLQVGPPLPGMPEYIVVGRTYAVGCTMPARDIPTQRLPFVDYLRNVLPNEWVASWPAASLDAGAIAVKQFAWYTAVIERKWRSRGYPFDVVDSTCDQYYRDASADPRTDAALQRTWEIVLTRADVPMRMSYRDTDATCGGRSNCMGQVESAVLASQGYSALQILARYFNAPGTTVNSTGSRLPAQLPPVPPALALPTRPSAPTATSSPAILLAPVVSPTPAPSSMAREFATVLPASATSIAITPSPTTIPPTATRSLPTGVPAVPSAATPVSPTPASATASGTPAPVLSTSSSVPPTAIPPPTTPTPIATTSPPAAAAQVEVAVVATPTLDR